MSNAALIQRWNVIKQVLDGHLSVREASAELGVSYRQALRLKQAAVEQGLRGLVHGNTGKLPWNGLDAAVRQRIVDLAHGDYARLTDARFAELLLRDEGIAVSRETVRKIRGRCRARPGGRGLPIAQRQRHVREGQNVLWDGIRDRWFAASPYSCVLMAAVDGGSGRCLAARFFPYEQSSTYLWLLYTIVRCYGVPGSIIQDCSELLKRTDAHWSVAEQLQGRQNPTPVTRAVKSLGVRPVYAESRRQQRYFGSIFEALTVDVAEALTVHGIDDIDAANCFLGEVFMPAFNARCAVAPGTAGPAWKSLPDSVDLDRVCSFLYEGTVSSANRVCVADIDIPIPATAQRISFARAMVEVRQLLDGSWRVYYQDRQIATHPPTPLREPPPPADSPAAPPLVPRLVMSAAGDDQQ